MALGSWWSAALQVVAATALVVTVVALAHPVVLAKVVARA